VDAIAPDGDFDAVTEHLLLLALAQFLAGCVPYQALSNGERFRADLAANHQRET